MADTLVKEIITALMGDPKLLWEVMGEISALKSRVVSPWQLVRAPHFGVRYSETRWDRMDGGHVSFATVYESPQGWRWEVYGIDHGYVATDLAARQQADTVLAHLRPDFLVVPWDLPEGAWVTTLGSDSVEFTVGEIRPTGDAWEVVVTPCSGQKRVVQTFPRIEEALADLARRFAP